MSDELTEIDAVAGIRIYSVASEPATFVYKAGLMIDADGSPRCYGPNNSGIDYTANGGVPGENWWGGPTDAQGWPLKQAIYDPCPGMYVCATSHYDPAYPESSQYRYIDSERIPFIVLPRNHANGAKRGDVCLCLNTRSADNCYGIFGDTGPENKIGEASMRMASALKINNSPKSGGTEDRIIAYLVFPNSVGRWVPPSDWFDVANALTHAWGGLSRLKKIAQEI
jgi:hypothetical protein